MDSRKALAWLRYHRTVVVSSAVLAPYGGGLWLSVHGEQATAFVCVVVACLLLLLSTLLTAEAVFVVALVHSALTGGPGGERFPLPVPASAYGLMTNALLVAGALLVLRALHRRTPLAQFKRWVPFLLLVGWIAFRVLGAQSTGAGVRAVVLVSTPIALALALVSAGGLGMRVEAEAALRAVMAAGAVCLAMLALGAITGSFHFVPLGFEAPFGGHRTVTLYLLVVIATSLAVARYSTGRTRVISAGLAVAALLVVYVSLSRMNAGIGFGLIVPLALVKPRRLGWLTAAVLGLALTAAVLSTGRFRSRSVVATPSASRVDEVHFTSGRSNVWPVVFESALESPVIGKGAGAARALVAQFRWEHPHSDYLRVFHDFGAIGLVLLLVAWLLRLWRHGRQWLYRRRNHAQGVHMAAFLGAAVVMVSFLTDNTLVYVFVTIPVLLLFALADRVDASSDELAG